MAHSLDYYCALPWRTCVTQDLDGSWALRVDGLHDLEVFAATEQEVREHFPDMLRCHLSAYLSLGLPIPVPVQTNTTSPPWNVLRWNMETNTVTQAP